MPEYYESNLALGNIPHLFDLNYSIFKAIPMILNLSLIPTFNSLTISLDTVLPAILYI